MTTNPLKSTWQSRWLPHPVLSLLLVGLWLALVSQVSGGSLVMAALLAIAIPRLTRSIWSDVPRVGSWGHACVYGLLVSWDVIVANVQVASLILWRSPRSLRSQWISVPLELESPEAIAVLAGTITLTPGTVSCDLSADGRSLLVHCLDTGDPESEVLKIKQRYESRLRRIFS